MPQNIVSERLRFNMVSDKVKGFIARGLLDEFHLREIIRLSPGDNLFPWLTTSQAWQELAEKAVHDRAKNGNWAVEDYRSWQHFGNKLDGTQRHQMVFHAQNRP